VIFNQPKYTRFSLVANFFTKMHILHIERIEIVIFYFFKNIFFWKEYSQFQCAMCNFWSRMRHQ
jgi:hypothetical protein